MWTPGTTQRKSSLFEQLVGRRGGGDLRDTAQHTISCSLPTGGSKGWDLYPLVSLGAQRFLKRAMAKDYSAPFSQLRPVFEFQACFTFPLYPASQLGNGTEGA